MTGLELLGAVGSATSIMAALVSWWKAHQAKNSAKLAQEAKQALLARSSDMAIATLCAEGAQVSDTTREILLGRPARRGTRREDQFGEVRRYVDHLEENLHHLPQGEDRKAMESIVTNTKTALSNLGEAAQLDRVHIDSVHNLIIGAVSILRRLRDLGREDAS